MKIELKLALPASDPVGVVRSLTRIPALAPGLRPQTPGNTWTVRLRDGSAVEVTLDIDHILVGDTRASLCELKLKLLEGKPDALFTLAAQIASAVATLPLCISKAERAYALARNTLHVPSQAKPPPLTADMPKAVAAQCVLRESFSQFTTNLNGLAYYDDPELVHQARVGWRRFKTSLKLFQKLTATHAPASLQPLRPLLDALGALRDLEVASLETLPMLANAYTEGNPRRQAHWRAMQQALALAADQQRDTLRDALSDPKIGMTLLAVTRWLEFDLTQLSNAAVSDPKHTLQDWARQHIRHWHGQMKTALASAHDPQSVHRARLLAKRLRYGIEALRPLLPKRRARHWHLMASKLQSDMGSARDVQQALAIATDLKLAPSLLDFLRGVVVGNKHGT
jgi:inorganic triphosphatase YgiF